MKPLSVAFLPGARDDIDSAFGYYQREQAGLEIRFTAAVRDQITRIQNGPEIYGFVHGDIRAACMRRFPYVVYYRIDPDQVIVVAVQHGSREWSHWLSRG
jgi:plasmid stabilization system protein ParE